MLVLLPPSETKRPGGEGLPLDLAALTAPELTPVRTELVEALVKLADDVPAARTALGLSAAQDDEVARNAACGAHRRSPPSTATPASSTTPSTSAR